MKPSTILCLLVCLTVAFGRIAVAQSESATLSGRITDPSGALVPGAQVMVTNIDTHASVSTTTNNAGMYVLGNLKPGNYRLTIVREGFRQIVKTGIILHVQDSLAENFTLAVGSPAESMTVVATAEELQTSPAVSTVVNNQFVDNMPLNGRSFQNLIQLTPGVVTTGASFASPGQFSVNGQRSETNYFTVDGVSGNLASTPGSGALDYGAGAFPALTASGGTNSLVSVDAMQEFRIQTSTFAPEYGRTPGAQVSIVTRSGANQFHGSLYEYFRNDIFDAADWFTDHFGQKKPALRQNDFGGTFSGPLQKDKLFFFFSYEGLRLRLPKTLSRDVPNLATRSAAVPAMQPFLDSFPIPNGADGGNGLARFTGSFSDPATLNAASLRLDFNPTQKWRFFTRYNYAPSSSDSRATEGTSLNDITQYSTTLRTGTIGASYTISDHALNEFRFNYSRNGSRDEGVIDNFGGAVPFASSLVLPSQYSLSNSAYVFGILVGDTPLHLLGNVSRSVQSQLNVVDSVTLVRGRHELKAGIDWRQLSPVVNPPNYLQQVLFGLFTGDLSTVIAGTADYMAVQSAQPNQQFIYPNWSLFGQDVWRVAPRVTLTYGLRWDYNPTPHAGDGMPAPYTVSGITNYEKFDATTPVTLAPLGTPIYQASRKNFAPRVGIAFNVHQSERWASTIRGGFGIFYDLGNTPVGSITGFPYTGESVSFLVPYPVAAPAPPIGDPTYPISSITVMDANLQTPYTLQWNSAYEQQLGKAQTLSVSYVGAAGRNLLRAADYEGLNPNFSSIEVFSNGGQSDFNSLQLQFQRQVTKGLQVLGSYTWAHAIDTESLSQGLQPPSRASADFDIRHTLSAALNYDIPGPKWNGFVKTALADWSVHSLIIARTAPPVELVAAFPSVPFSFVARPDVVPGEPFYISDSSAPGGRRFNPAAFSFPAQNTQGDLPRNALRGFAASQVDLAIQRNLPLRESLALRIRADIFNIFNHPNFGPPDRRLYSSDFGIATQTLAQSLGAGGADGGFSPVYQMGGPRSIQLSLRLEF